MGNLPSIPGESSAVKAAADQIKKDKQPPRSRSYSLLGRELDEYGYPIGGLRRSKLHRNMHRLKLANNKTKRIRRRKNLTLKLRR